MVTGFDLYDLLIRGDKTKDAKLLSGDVIFIPPVGPQAAVFGSVRNPAIYELRPGESLAAVLADAGGVSAVAAEARVSIERIDEHRDRQAMEVAYDTRRPGDSVGRRRHDPCVLDRTQVQKTVILRGNTANPGRFAWHEGMRISDLIPDKDSLLTRNYWWRRAQLGLPTPEFESVPDWADQRQPAENQPVASSANCAAQGLVRQAASPSLSPVLSAQQGSGQRAARGPGRSASPNQSMPPGQRTDVQLPAPEIDWDYAVIERLNQETLKTELIPFDLGKLVLQHDASQDVALQPGDVVSISSRKQISACPWLSRQSWFGSMANSCTPVCIRPSLVKRCAILWSAPEV